ncbi:2'-5' RNA ligase [Nostoc sp. 3335mG]|nr:2'-5' RNA ligase [Nostoc sp. 3335mG]
MSNTPHYARTIGFDQLVAELHAARAERAVYSRRDGPLQLWCYTSKAVYDRLWSPATLAARGLILDVEERRVVATAFPKFFNLGEAGTPVPDGPCEAFEKVDGSLIVIFHHDGRWRAATKGALDSSQALWAEARLRDQGLSALVPGTTYLAEALYAENRIVVRYDESGLVLLAAYDEQGFELDFDSIEATAQALGWRAAGRIRFAGIDDLIARAGMLPADAEGYVLRFAGGQRVKLKGAEYSRIHAILSRVTPLGIWDAMVAGDSLDEMRRVIPEEFWWDFDEIVRLLREAMQARINRVGEVAAELAGLSDREVGLRLATLPKEVARYLFIYRRNPDLTADGKAWSMLLRDVRPVGNALPGYTASYALSQATGDE